MTKVTLENCWEISNEVKHMLILWARNFIWKLFIQESETICPQKDKQSIFIAALLSEKKGLILKLCLSTGDGTNTL